MKWLFFQGIMRHTKHFQIQPDFSSYLIVPPPGRLSVPSPGTLGSPEFWCLCRNRSPKTDTSDTSDTSRSAKPLNSWATCVAILGIWISRSTAFLSAMTSRILGLNRLNKARNVQCFFARVKNGSEALRAAHCAGEPWQNPPIQPSTSSSRWPCG